MCDGGWITLTNNVALETPIKRTAFYNSDTTKYDASGTISITYGEYSMTGKVILAPEVSVETDKEVECFYTEEGELITGVENESKWVYRCSE